MSEEVNIVWHTQTVSRADRETAAGHRGCVIWLTGLSGCGKSTVANLVDHKLHALGVRSYVLDGDNVRHGLNSPPKVLGERHNEAFAARFGLTFSPADREENIRRIGEVAALFCDAGLVTLAAFVSPYRRDRDAVRQTVAEGDFIEVFVDAPLDVCEQRDPKGLYRQAREGKIKDFTGIDAPYEPPEKPELVLAAATTPAVELADQVVEFLRSTGRIG